MATDPRAALDTHGTLYDGAAARGGEGRTVHVDADCNALADDHDDITEPAELPLRARVCQKCDPAYEIDYTAGNTGYDDVPAIEDHDDGLRPDGGHDAEELVELGHGDYCDACGEFVFDWDDCDCNGEGHRQEGLEGFTTDGGRVVPSDYDGDDGWGENGLEQCPHCGDQLGGEAGRHEDVYDQRGRHFEYFLDTDSSKGPFFCPECWEELDRNRKAAKNDSLEAYTDGAGERIAVSVTTGVVYAVGAHEPAGDGKIIAEEKRPLTRAEIGARLEEVHGPARRCYRDHLGGETDD